MGKGVGEMDNGCPSELLQGLKQILGAKADTGTGEASLASTYHSRDHDFSSCSGTPAPSPHPILQ